MPGDDWGAFYPMAWPWAGCWWRWCLSLVSEKKVRYMLPLLPPLALLTAGALRYWETAFRRRQATRSDHLHNTIGIIRKLGAKPSGEIQRL